MISLRGQGSFETESRSSFPSISAPRTALGTLSRGSIVDELKAKRSNYSLGKCIYADIFGILESCRECEKHSDHGHTLTMRDDGSVNFLVVRNHSVVHIMKLNAVDVPNYTCQLFPNKVGEEEKTKP